MPIICPKLNKENKAKQIVHIKINDLKIFFKILNKMDNEHIKIFGPISWQAYENQDYNKFITQIN